jgi:hypothetical protein
MLRSPLVVTSLVACLAGPAPAQLPTGATVAPTRDALADSLIHLERQSWEAWRRRDGAFFQRFLSDDHVEVGFGGVNGKATVVAGVASPSCTVTDYALDSFGLTRFDSTTALLTYHASQHTTCNGRAVPSPVWVGSLYVRRGGVWVNAVYQQSQASR